MCVGTLNSEWTKWVEALGVWLPDAREDFLEEAGLGLGKIWIVKGKAY